ncbi:MAG: uL13 family ribosomal protein [Candidatus Micrarchaeia archaeon]
MVVIDAQDAVVGRLGARVAKLLMSGQAVEIINPDKALMRGSLSAAKEKYLSRRHQKDKRTPENSPHWPRSPHLLLRRMIRGMLPFGSSRRGRDAYHRLKVHAIAPEGVKAQRIAEAESGGQHGTFSISELSESLGYHGRKPASE